MEPTWTDIAQAIAAMIAIPGAIAAFVILFKRDKATGKLTDTGKRIELCSPVGLVFTK